MENEAIVIGALGITNIVHYCKALICTIREPVLAPTAIVEPGRGLAILDLNTSHNNLQVLGVVLG